MMDFLACFSMPPALAGPYIVNAPAFNRTLEVPVPTAQERATFLASRNPILPLVVGNYEMQVVNNKTGADFTAYFRKSVCQLIGRGFGKGVDVEEDEEEDEEDGEYDEEDGEEDVEDGEDYDGEIGEDMMDEEDMMAEGFLC